MLRGLVCAIGGLFVVGALALAAVGCFPAAGLLAVWALIFLVGLAVERWRYKPIDDRAPKPDWQETGERFIDPETGKLITVYVQSSTGERRYVAAPSTLSR
jgi:hypothetical protein